MQRPRAGIPRPSRGVLIAVVLAILAALSFLLLPRGPAPRPLDPASASSSGARAFAEVLGRHGVHLRAARGLDEFQATQVGPDATLVVTNASDLSERALAAVRERRVHRLVLIAPSDPVLKGLGVPAQVAGRGQRLTAGCTSPVAGPEDTISAGSWLYRPTGTSTHACFRPEDDPDAPSSSVQAAYLTFPATATRPDTVVLGQETLFANAHITRESHATVALRMFAGDSDVVWFVPVPDSTDPPIEQAGPEAPSWIGPALTVLGLTVLMLCLWRGRRLGPLVTEPLPVVVPAGETTRARARLYRRAGDDDAVARLLTDAAVADIRSRLRLPAEATPLLVAQAVHRTTGDDVDEVHALLSGPAGQTTLADHAARLRRLRRKVRTS